MIEIRSFFTDWHEVDEKTAKQYVRTLLKGITALSMKERIKYIEENRLRGITIKELLES